MPKSEGSISWLYWWLMFPLNRRCGPPFSFWFHRLLLTSLERAHKHFLYREQVLYWTINISAATQKPSFGISFCRPLLPRQLETSHGCFSELSLRSICDVSKEWFRLIGAMGCCGFGPAVDVQAIMGPAIAITDG